MFKLKLKNQSILRKILFPTILLMLVQAGLFGGTFISSGSISLMNSNAFDILNERVINRRNYIQNDMLQRWSQLQETVSSIDTSVTKILEEQNKEIRDLGIDQQLTLDVTLASSTELLYTLRKNSVTGIFLVYTQGKREFQNGSYAQPGLYIRDLDPSSGYTGNSDLLVEVGSSEITKQIQITMDTWWQPQFILESDKYPERCAYYEEPLKAAIENPDLGYSDLGYWSKPFRFSSEDIEVMTYSVPLRYKDGTVYGILGIELSMDFIQKQIPSSEIGYDARGSYLIGIREEDAPLHILAGSGSLYKRYFINKEDVILKNASEVRDGYQLITENSDNDEIYGCLQDFKLYNSNTPFSNQVWSIMGIVEKDILLGFSQNVMTTVLLSLVIAFCLGVLGAYIMSKLITKPISLLAEKVKKSDPQLPVHFEKINIEEIDDLSSSIVTLSQSVAESASKLSQIIELADIPIAAFEIQKDAEKVFYTGRFFDFFEIEAEKGKFMDDYKQPLQKLNGFLESSSEDGQIRIYKVPKKDASFRWIRIKIVEDKTKILGVATDITQEILEKRKIEYERDYDLLTNILNRRAFHRIMKKLFEAPEQIAVGALLMLDLDNLKYINDTYGHDYGDEYIKSMADILKKFSSHQCLVSRMSGDEFNVFIFGKGSKDEILNVIHGIRNQIKHSLFPLPDDENFKIRASAGIAWYPKDSKDYEELIKFADFAMYKAKNTIKGEFREFDSASYGKDSYLLHSKEELNKIIDEGLVSYCFQPIVDAKTGKIFAYEALMRSRSNILRSPLEILTMAKSQSKLYAIEKLTWFQALKAFAEHEEEMGDARIFINSIPSQLLNERDMESFIRTNYKYLHRIVIELTEDEKMSSEFTEKKKKYIKDWKGMLALDDFGTGYNGETALLELSPDFVKIDMSIVRNIDTDESRLRLLQNFVAFSRKQGYKIIAEGVETYEEMRTLIENGVDYLQGYYTARPEFSPQNIKNNILEEIHTINGSMEDWRIF